MHLPGLTRLVYSLVALWAIGLGTVFVIGMVDPRELPWNADLLSMLQDEDFRNFLSIFTRFIGGLMLGIGLVIFTIVVVPRLHSAERANVIVFALCLTILIPQFFTWIQLGLPASRVILLGAGILMVIVSFWVGRIRLR